MGRTYVTSGLTCRQRPESLSSLNLSSQSLDCSLLPFPASGSLYHTKDMQPELERVEVPIVDSACDGHFCIIPNTKLSLWHGKRLNIETDRGPCTYQSYLSISTISLLISPKEYHSTSIVLTEFSKVTDPAAALEAEAKKEISYLTTFGRPLHPFQRLHREIYGYQARSPSGHLSNL